MVEHLLPGLVEHMTLAGEPLLGERDQLLGGLVVRGGTLVQHRRVLRPLQRLREPREAALFTEAEGRAAGSVMKT